MEELSNQEKEKLQNYILNVKRISGLYRKLQIEEPQILKKIKKFQIQNGLKSITEACYWILNNLREKPSCQKNSCNKNTKFLGFKQGYERLCSICKRKENYKKTCQERYGVDNAIKTSKFKEKRSKKENKAKNIQKPDYSSIDWNIITKKERIELQELIKPFSEKNNFIGISRKIECNNQVLFEKCKLFKDKNELVNWEETLFWIVYRLKEKPTCRSEGCNRKDLKFYNYNHGYKLFCPTCSMKKTNLEKFGVEHATQTREVQEKRKQTCLEKYGIDHVCKLKKVKERIKQSLKENWGEEGYSHPIIRRKKEQTNSERYGRKWATQTENIQEKRKETCKEKYGEDHWMKTDKKKREFSEMWKGDYQDKLLQYHREFCKSRGFELINYTRAHEDSKFKCLDCHYEFYRNWNEFKSRNIIICPNCFKNQKPKQYGRIEEKIIQDLDLDSKFNVHRRNKTIISPQELDLYIPERNIAIEYCGLWCHNSGGAISNCIEGKPANYHLNKLEKCEKQGIQLITIFEDEWLLKPEVVLSSLSNKLDLNNQYKIRAKNCKIKIVNKNEKTEFLEKNHLHGDQISSINVGLYYQNNLVSIATFRRLGNNLELTRFCSEPFHIVYGGLGKILKYIKENYSFEKIITYADRRWSNGHIYYKLGFEFKKKTKPGHWYWGNDIIGRKHWWYFKRKDLIERYPEYSNLKKLEIVKKLGYCWIFDCGNLRFELKR